MRDSRATPVLPDGRNSVQRRGSFSRTSRVILAAMDDVENLASRSGIPADSFADAVFNRYAGRLIEVAGRRLGGNLRAKVSPEDVVQSAFKSFFRRQNEFRFGQDGADGLWGLLVVITLRKCAKWADVFRAGKRAADREIPLPASIAWQALAAREPGPEEAAMLSETVERLFAPLDERQRQMIALRMQGYELEQIAGQTQSSRRTVARVVAEAKSRLAKILEDDAK
jgi:RNA polymerase sigma-70 factor (ECF subfamily)